MFLKDHLKDTYSKASLDNNILLLENIITRWAHRFGVDSLNDLLIQNQVSTKANEELDEDQINLIAEANEELDEDQINLKLIENSEVQAELISKSNYSKSLNDNQIINKDFESDENKVEYNSNEDLPLPYINNLRKWINNEKEAS